MAIITYTEGIKIECRNKDVEANLRNNRSAANYSLKNYNICLKDCELALLLKPTYEKALVRAAKCCFEIANYLDAIKYCNIILDGNSGNKPISRLMQKNFMRHMSSQMHTQFKNKKNIDKQVLLQTIKSRGVKLFCFEENDYEFEDLTPIAPELALNTVHLNADKKLVWPVVFILADYKVIQCVTQFCEDEM